MALPHYLPSNEHLCGDNDDDGDDGGDDDDDGDDDGDGDGDGDDDGEGKESGQQTNEFTGRETLLVPKGFVRRSQDRCNLLILALPYLHITK